MTTAAAETAPIVIDPVAAEDSSPIDGGIDDKGTGEMSIPADVGEEGGCVNEFVARWVGEAVSILRIGEMVSIHIGEAVSILGIGEAVSIRIGEAVCIRCKGDSVAAGLLAGEGVGVVIPAVFTITATASSEPMFPVPAQSPSV